MRMIENRALPLDDLNDSEIFRISLMRMIENRALPLDGHSCSLRLEPQIRREFKESTAAIHQNQQNQHPHVEALILKLQKPPQ